MDGLGTKKKPYLAETSELVPEKIWKVLSSLGSLKCRLYLALQLAWSLSKVGKLLGDFR